jgi:iduronate 2-sulfatase
MADDLRPMLGSYGDPHVRTPNLDRLAAESVIFDRAYCQVAVCGPSRASLISGLRTETLNFFRHGNEELKFFRRQFGHLPSLPEHFKAKGYRTLGFGKITHDGWEDATDWSEPFFPGREREMWEIVDLERIREVPFAARALVPTIIANRMDCPAVQAPDVPDDALFAGRMTNRILDQLPTLGGQPFFLAVGYRRPHLPLVAPKKYFDQYAPTPAWLPANRRPPVGAPIMAYFNSDSYVRIREMLPSPPPDEATAVAWNGFELRSYNGVPDHGVIPDVEQLELRRAYYACISYVDAQVGRLIDGLRAAGLWENTIVVFTSDHGWHLGEHSVWTKRTNYELDTRVPLIIRVPGETSRRTATLSELVDLYPTLCELAGLPAPAHLEGSSLAPVLRGREEPGGIALSQFTRYDTHMGRAIRTDRYRYVEWSEIETGRLSASELYDHRDDPGETINRAQDPSFASVVQELSGRLHNAYGLPSAVSPARRVTLHP